MHSLAQQAAAVKVNLIRKVRETLRRSEYRGHNLMQEHAVYEALGRPQLHHGDIMRSTFHPRISKECLKRNHEH